MDGVLNVVRMAEEGEGRRIRAGGTLTERSAKELLLCGVLRERVSAGGKVGDVCVIGRVHAESRVASRLCGRLRSRRVDLLRQGRYESRSGNIHSLGGTA